LCAILVGITFHSKTRGSFFVRRKGSQAFIIIFRWSSFAEETYNSKEPTNRSHPIVFEEKGQKRHLYYVLHAKTQAKRDIFIMYCMRRHRPKETSLLCTVSEDTGRKRRLYLEIIEYRAVWSAYKSLLSECRALLRECRALLRECRALLRECRALLRECRALLREYRYISMY